MISVKLPVAMKFLDAQVYAIESGEIPIPLYCVNNMIIVKPTAEAIRESILLFRTLVTLFIYKLHFLILRKTTHFGLNIYQ